MAEIETRADGDQDKKAWMAKVQEDFNNRQRQSDDARMKLK